MARKRKKGFGHWIKDRLNPFRKTQKRLDDYASRLRLRERETRLFDAVKFNKEEVSSDAPNLRNNWQAKPLRDQARHLYENDPIARRVVDSICSNMVGEGIMPMAECDHPIVKKRVQNFLDHWVNCVECDFDGTHSIIGLQSLIVKALVRDGSVFVHRTFNKKKLQLQVLEADYLDIYSNRETAKGGEIRNGIEFDRHGRVIAYHLYEHHPDDVLNGVQYQIDDPRAISTGYRGRGGEVIRIRAAHICHIRKVDRPNQQDGLSWLAPALEKLWDLKEYEQAKLIQQKIQASFTGFVEDNFSLSEEEREDFLGESEDGNSLTRSVRPGTIEELPFGKTVTFPPAAATPNEDFVERCLRQIAGALGVSYEIFNDYSQVNFSSGRMGFLEMDRQLKHYAKTILMPQLLDKVGGWVIEHLQYHGQVPTGYRVSIKWVLPVREMIDPEKETNTIMKLVTAGLMSYQEAHTKLGKNFDKNIQEIKAGIEIYQDNDLPLLPVIEEETPPEEAPLIEETNENQIF